MGRDPDESRRCAHGARRAGEPPGARERGPAPLTEAADAYRENTRARAPIEWARNQNNLGFALGVLGERESGTARLEEAIAAFRDALQERTRERVPLQWATSTGY